MITKYLAIALLGVAPLLSMGAGVVQVTAAPAKSQHPAAAPASPSSSPASMLRGLAYNTPVGASDTSRHGTNSQG